MATALRWWRSFPSNSCASFVESVPPTNVRFGPKTARKLYPPAQIVLELGMNDFSTEGFLNPLAEPRGGEELLHRFPGELQLFKEVNRECMAAQWAIDVPQERRGVMATALFSRFITNTQAAGILGVRGMQRQMLAMLRIALESLFAFRAVVKSQEFFGKYSRAQTMAKFKYAKSIDRLGGAAAVDQARVNLHWPMCLPLHHNRPRGDGSSLMYVAHAQGDPDHIHAACCRLQG